MSNAHSKLFMRHWWGKLSLVLSSSTASENRNERVLYNSKLCAESRLDLSRETFHNFSTLIEALEDVQRRLQWRVWNPTCVRKPEHNFIAKSKRKLLKTFNFLFINLSSAHLMSNIKCNHFDNFSFTNYLAINLLSRREEHVSIAVEWKAPSTDFLDIFSWKIEDFQKAVSERKVHTLWRRKLVRIGLLGCQMKIHARQVDGWKIHKIREMISPQEHPPGR